MLLICSNPYIPVKWLETLRTDGEGCSLYAPIFKRAKNCPVANLQISVVCFSLTVSQNGENPN